MRENDPEETTETVAEYSERIARESFEMNARLTSKPRASAYAFCATLLAVIAFYAGWEANETAVWAALIATGIPFGGLMVATVRTWPKRH